MALLKQGDKVALVGCSNGQGVNQEKRLQVLIEKLRAMKLEVSCSPYLYAKESIFSGSGKERAEALMSLYEDVEIKAIFDISGGDVANEILPYLNYEGIRRNSKPFFGYSDVTTVLNALYTKAKAPVYLYQIRNIIGSSGSVQQEWFKASLFSEVETLFKFEYEFVVGEKLEGEVLGGNIRCLLKLAGTPYFPDFQDKVLFLEAMSGDVAKHATYLAQLQQLGVFNQIRGVLLGSFTEMEEKQLEPGICKLLIKQLGERTQLSIVKTNEIGHGGNSKALKLGSTISLVRQ